MFVLPERGYSITTSSGIKLLAALDEEAARDLLLGTLAAGPEGQPTNVEWITSAQQWAIAPALEAGLKLQARRRRLPARRRGAVPALPPERGLPLRRYGFSTEAS